jgi:hypothetical protein
LQLRIAMICFLTTRQWQACRSCGLVFTGFCRQSFQYPLSITSSVLPHGLWFSVSVTVLSTRVCFSVSMLLEARL